MEGDCGMRKNLGWTAIVIAFVAGIIAASSTRYKAAVALSLAKLRVEKAFESNYPPNYSMSGIMGTCRATNEPIECSFDKNGDVLITYFTIKNGEASPYRSIRVTP